MRKQTREVNPGTPGQSPVIGLGSSPQPASAGSVNQFVKSLTLTKLLENGLGFSHFSRFLNREIKCSLIDNMLNFCFDAGRCVRYRETKNSPKEADTVHDLMHKYLLPGSPQFINPGSDKFPMPQYDPKVKNGAVIALRNAALQVLEAPFRLFLESEDLAQFVSEELDGKITPMVHAEHLEPLPPPVESLEPSVISWSLVKINDRGKRQHRTLRFSQNGAHSLLGDDLRFHYWPRDIHGLLLSNDNPKAFKLACLHYYDYECETEMQRFLVAESFAEMKLGSVSPPLEQVRQAVSQKAINTPSMKDFNVQRVLGRGALGKVMKVTHIESGREYAMKSIQVPALIKQKQVDRAHIEVEILKNLNHPFLVRLHYSFVDASNQLCMCLDYAYGGDLFFELKKHRNEHGDCGLAAHHAGFYIAEAVLAIEYLHNHDIVHRDLKPENILLAADGHLLITDFGLSKIDVTCFSGEGDEFGTRAQSMVGTKEYVAPEIVQHKAYGKAVDWWAIGVLFYELLHGHPPFEPRGGKTLFQAIVAGKFSFAERVNVPDAAQDLIRRLLHPSPEERPGPVQIKAHPFFTDEMSLDWLALLNKEYPPPVVPEFRDEDKNFPSRLAKVRLNSFIDELPRLPEQEVESFCYTKKKSEDDFSDFNTSFACTPSNPRGY